MSFTDVINVADQILGDIEAPYVNIYSAMRQIGGIIPDVAVREILSDEDTITSHPVEGGTPISDHVFRNPYLIELSYGWSDSTGGYPGYVQTIYQTMLALRATREPFDVDTGKRSYSNMLFGNITVATDETSEFTLMVTARLQEVIITDTNGVPSTGPAAPEADVGPQALQLVTTPQPGIYGNVGGIGAA